MVLDERQRLLAVLVRLSDDNEVAPGQWFVEAGFGRLDGKDYPTFFHLDIAQDWIANAWRTSANGLAPEDSFNWLGRSMNDLPQI